jgi:hypothetical protein
MKTAMQELIDWLNNYPTEIPTIHKSAILAKAESLLEEEKEQIIDARVDGDTWSTAIKEMRTAYAELYYNETFNIK